MSGIPSSRVTPTKQQPALVHRDIGGANREKPKLLSRTSAYPGGRGEGSNQGHDLNLRYFPQQCLAKCAIRHYTFLHCFLEASCQCHIHVSIFWRCLYRVHRSLAVSISRCCRLFV